jgi:zinc protease
VTLTNSDLADEVTRAFVGWQGGSAPVRNTQALTLSEPKVENVQVNGKTSVSVLLGQASGLGHQHPDAMALRVATAILGSGFTGRLMANVRDKEGLTYGVSASMGNDSFNQGDWRITGPALHRPCLRKDWPQRAANSTLVSARGDSR